MGPSTYIPFGHNRLLIRKIKTKGKVSIEINLGKKNLFTKYSVNMACMMTSGGCGLRGTSGKIKLLNYILTAK